MISAVDTSVPFDLILSANRFTEPAIAALEEAGHAGSLLLCDIVICGCAGASSSSGLRAACFAASRAWKLYRRQGGKRVRILPDFLIGAHAQLQASRLISRDRGFYRTVFPGLALLDPATR